MIFLHRLPKLLLGLFLTFVFIAPNSFAASPPLNCGSALTLQCGQIFNGTTANGTDVISDFSSVGLLLDGREKIHTFVLPQASNLKLVLTGSSTQRIVLLSACDVLSAVGTDNDTLLANNLAAGTYFLVIDNISNAIGGSYLLLLTCAPTDVCPSNGISSKEEFISSVTVAGASKNSGNEGGYANFEATPLAKLSPGQVVPFAVAGTFVGGNYGQKLSVWIDFDHDFLFNSTNENVFLSDSVFTNTIEGQFQLPANVPVGVPLQMRVKMEQGSVVPAACGSYHYGETEDYTLSVALPCIVPAGLQFFVTAPGAGLCVWSGSAAQYQLRYRKSTASNWVNQTLLTPYLPLTGLETESEYRYQVRSICNGAADTSNWSPFILFTPAMVSNCAKIAKSAAYDLGTSSVKLVWSRLENATKYQTRYRVTGSAYTSITSTTPTILLSNLMGGSKYNYQIRSFCNGSWTVWSSNFTFTTL